MNSDLFIEELKTYQEADVFNPYTDICEVFDLADANKIRSKNLKQVIDSFTDKQVDSIWIGRDLGHRGGRRTGLALTDEANLISANGVWEVELDQATRGELFFERTAANIWGALKEIDEKIFMWNVFPFHPHEERNPFSNRSHTAKERDAGIEFLGILIRLLKPRRIVAIGNDAFKCSLRIFDNDKVHKIRHPSYGGEKTFTRQIRELYGLSDHTRLKYN